MQMRLYTMHKGQHLLIFIMFLCLFLIALLMGMAGPRIIAEHVEKATTLKNPQQKNKTGIYGLTVVKLAHKKIHNFR